MQEICTASQTERQEKMEKLSNPQKTIEVIKKYDFAFQKKFGQNFLIDAHVLNKIIASADITKDDCVLEIGPGIGTMTQYLAEAAGKVVAVEIDRNLIPILSETLADYENVTVINEDVLKLDIAKLADEYRIVLMTDTHFGSIQAPEVLEEKVDEINSLNADMIILCGDITDESTTREQLDQVFEIYSRMKSRYGTFYTYGNHDRQEYAVANRRAYTPEEFAEVVRSHGIKILQDDFVNIGNDLVLVGREDKSWKETPRLSSETLLKDVDRSRFIIVSDHQPVDAEVNAAQGADLQLSGHTHAGQIYPFGLFIELVGKLNYGEYHRGNLTAIVSSGTTGWGFPIRTEEHCEYVLVTLKPAQ